MAVKQHVSLDAAQWKCTCMSQPLQPQGQYWDGRTPPPNTPAQYGRR